MRRFIPTELDLERSCNLTGLNGNYYGPPFFLLFPLFFFVLTRTRTRSQYTCPHIPPRHNHQWRSLTRHRAGFELRACSEAPRSREPPPTSNSQDHTTPSANRIFCTWNFVRSILGLASGTTGITNVKRTAYCELRTVGFLVGHDCVCAPKVEFTRPTRRRGGRWTRIQSSTRSVVHTSFEILLLND